GLLAFLVLSLRAREAEDRDANRAHDIVLRLLDANIAETPAAIGELADYRRWADPELERVVADPAARRDRRLRARLALLPADGRHADALHEEMLEADPQDFAVIRVALAPHADGMVDGLWDLLEKKAGDPRRRFRTAAARFRAAAALAAYDPTNPRWDAAGRWV